jgi:DNA-binding CsgD family transcriptional regulator
MSSSFTAAMEKVNYGKYIDQIQDELKNALAELGPGKTPEQVESIQMRLQGLMRKQSRELAQELGISGNHVLVFMASTAIISTAWLSFALKKETSDLTKSPEDRLELMEMLDALGTALSNVIAKAANHADMTK